MVSSLASVEASVVSFQGTVAAMSVILARRDSKISTFSLNSCKTITHELCQIGRCSCFHNLKLFKETTVNRFMPGMTMSAGRQLGRLAPGRSRQRKLTK